MLRILNNLFRATPPPSNPPPAPKASAQAISTASQKADRIILSMLSQAPSLSERKRIKNTLIDPLIQIASRWRDVNWRQFALMHNASIIWETALEGGNTDVSIDAWLYFLELWEKNKSLFFTTKMTPRIASHIKDALLDMKELYALMPKEQISPLSDTELIKQATNFRNKVLEKLEKKGYCYAPLGYRYGVANEGHIVPWKFSLTKDAHGKRYIIAYDLNQGNGSEDNPILNFTTANELVSLRGFPVKFAEEVFKGEFGLAGICQLFRYQSDPPDSAHPHYEGSNIRDILLTLGELEATLGDHPEKYQSKSQRFGVCPEKAVKNVAHDILIEHELSLSDIKTVFLDLYLFSLLAGFHTFNRNPTPNNQASFLNAITEFNIALKKSEKNLLVDEFIAAETLILKLEKKIQKHTFPPVRKSRKKLLLPQDEETYHFPAVPISLNPAAPGSQTSGDASKSYDISLPEFCIDQAQFVLKSWMTTLENLPPKKVFSYLYDAVTLLPLPEWKKEGLWDTLPKTEIESVILLLEQLLKVGLQHETLGSENCTTTLTKQSTAAEQFLIIHTLYVITDKLARKIPENQLEGFAPPFVPLLFNFRTDTFTAFHYGEHHQRYDQIYSYFVECILAANCHMIFPVDEVLSVELFIHEHKRKNYSIQGAAHIAFLQQFLSKAFPSAANLELTPLYLELWKDNEKKPENRLLPLSIHSLYYYAFIAYIHFSAKTDHFPSSLTFSDDLDSAEKQALRINKDMPKLFSLDLSNANQDKNGIKHDHFTDMLDVEEKFFPFFKADLKKISTNEAVCEQLDENTAKKLKITEPIFRDLLRMTRHPSISPWMALEWIKDPLHSVYFGHKGIQKVLEYCLFNPRARIQRRMQEASRFLEEFRGAIQTHLEYYKGNPYQVDAILYLIRLGSCLETHAQCVLEDQNNDLILQFYQKNLITLREKILRIAEKKEDEKRRIKNTLNEITLHLVWTQCLQKHFSSEQLANLFLSITQLQGIYYFNNEYRWLLKVLPSAIRKSRLNWQEFLKHQDSLNTTCNTILKYFIENFSDTTWQGTFPCYHCPEGYRIDFQHLTIHSSRGNLKKLTDFYDHHGIKHFKEWHGEQFWEEANRFTSMDGKFRYQESEASCPNFERSISLNGAPIWCRLHRFDPYQIDPLKLHFLAYPEQDLLPWDHYIPLEKNGDLPDIITYDRKTDSPYFRIDIQSKGEFQITRVDTLGNVLPIRLMNLVTLEKKYPNIAKFILRIVPAEHVLVFAHEQTQEIEEIHFYYHLRMKFIRNGDHLEWSNLPGYRLCIEEYPKELNFYPGAIVLRHPNGDKKIILPAKKLTLSGPDLAKVVLPGEHFVHSPSYYFVFGVDSRNGNLIHHEPLANLYLNLLFKMQKDYKRADHYLNKINFREFCDEWHFRTLIEEFKKIRDRSAPSLAFNINLFLLIVDTKELLLEKQFTQQQTDRFYAEIMRTGKSFYLDYLRAISAEDLSAIPKDLVLTPAEEARLLTALKTFCEEEKEELPRILALRYKLICSDEREADITISSLQVSLRPKIYNKLPNPNKLKLNPLPEDCDHFPYGEHRIQKAYPREKEDWVAYPIRLNCYNVEVKFPELYEQARHCTPFIPDQILPPDPFDFTLLTLLNMNSISNSSLGYVMPQGNDLGVLLFYVRFFSDVFSDLSLANTQDYKVANQTFNQILERVKNLESHERYPLFCSQFLNATKTFNYTKSFKLALPPSKNTTTPLPITPPKAFNRTPLRFLMKELFTKEKITTKQRLHLPESPPFIDNSLYPKKPGLEQKLLKRLEGGYEQLKGRKTPSYTFQEGNLTTTQEKLQQFKQGVDKEITDLENTIHRLANTPYKLRHGQLCKDEDVLKEMHFRQAKSTLQIPQLHAENIMFEVILCNRLDFLTQKCPLLQLDEIQALLTAVKDYYHLLSLSQLCEEANEKIEEIKKHPHKKELQGELAYLLDYKFRYDPRLHPEIAYTKIKTGKLPRSNQADTYLWVKERVSKKESCLIQLPAGDGKTSYINPLLTLMALQLGLTPVIFTTQMMYPVDKENYTTTLSQLGIKLRFLEVGMAMKLSAADLKLIYEKLTQYHHDKNAILITPHVYYSLYLFYRYAAIKEKDTEKTRYLSLILNHFEKQCLNITDECHRNLDTLTRAIYGIGDFQYLSNEEQKLFLGLMKPLLGVIEVLTDDGVPLSYLSKLKTNLLETPNKQEIALIQKELAKHMCETSLLRIPSSLHGEFIHYWTHKKAPQPQLLKQWGQSQDEEERKKADLVALVGYFILELFPEILKLRTDVDHVPSIFPEEEFDCPAQNKSPSTAQFDDPYRTLVLTDKGAYQRGLFAYQVRALLIKLIEKDQLEQRGVYSQEEDKVEILFKEWLKDSPIASLSLMDICLSNPSQMKEVNQVLKMHPGTIEYYLANVILPQVGYCPEQLTCTPTHMINGFNVSVVMSATPGDSIIYPKKIMHFRYDPVFEAEVTTRFCIEENQRKIHPKTTVDFFTHAQKEHKEALLEHPVHIDVDGFFDYKNKKVAQQILEVTQLDVVQHIKDARTIDVDRHEKLILLRKNHPSIECSGSDLEETYKNHQWDRETLKVGTFYDSAHAESLNIPQKAGTRSFIYLGKKTPLPRLIQALMRKRGFLNPQMHQYIMWVIQEDIAAKVPKTEVQKLDGRAITHWANRNNAKELKKRVILIGFQEIAFLIEEEANQEIKGALHDPERQIALHATYERGFAEKNIQVPYEMFGEHDQKKDAQDVLMSFAKQRYEAFGYQCPFDQCTSLKENIQGIIDEVKELVDKIATNFNNKVAKEVERHTRMNRETEKVQYRPHNFNPLWVAKLIGDLDIWKSDFMEGIFKISCQTIFTTLNLTHDFYYEINQLLTASRNKGDMLNEKYLKPIDFILIVMDDQRRWAVAMNNDFIPGYLKKLMECPEASEISLPHRAFIVTKEGELCQRGRNALSVPEEEVQEILNSAWLRDIVIDAALLRGEIRYPDRLKERIASWEGFEEFWKKIVDALPNPETADISGMSKLIKQAQFLKKNLK